MMKFGMPSLTEVETPRQWAEICAELGLQFVELNMNFPQCGIQALDGEQLKQIAKEYGIYFTVHLDDNMNAADFNPYVAEAYKRTMVELIEIAKVAQIPVLNMHHPRGAVYTLPHRKLYFFDEFRKAYYQNLRSFRDACEYAIGESDVRVCVENSGGYLDFQQDGLELLLESPAFALTYDIGHNHCANNMDEAWILAHGSRLMHMHMHDAKSYGKDHMTLGTGEMDIPKYCNLALDKECSVVLETKTLDSLRESVQWLRLNRYL